MFNTNQYNTALYNAESQIFDFQASQDDIVFNGLSLQNENIITSKVTYDDLPSRNFKTFKIPREDGEGIISDFYRRKVINLTGTILGNNKDDLNDRIDEFKKKLSALNGSLEIKVNGVIRRFNATQTLQVVFNRKNYHVTFVTFKLSFAVILPFGTDINYTFNELFSVNQLDIITQISNEGTCDAHPLFTLMFQSAVGVGSIFIENQTTGQKITVDHTFVQNDVLQIDSENKTVKINGVLVDYLGVFPDLALDTNRFDIVISGVSVNYNFTLKYLKTYL